MGNYLRHIEFRFLRFFTLYLFQGWGLWKETWRSTKPQEEDLRGMCTRPEGQCRQGCHLQGCSLDSQWPKMSLNHSNRCSDQIVSHETRKTVPRSHTKYRLYSIESLSQTKFAYGHLPKYFWITLKSIHKTWPLCMILSISHQSKGGIYSAAFEWEHRNAFEGNTEMSLLAVHNGVL